MKIGTIDFEGKHHNEPVFENTQVPVKVLFDYFETGKSIDKFLNDFPSVNHKQVIEIIHMARLLITSEQSLKAKFC